MNKIVVADAGPLIAFARLEKLSLLPLVFKQVLVKTIVLEESAGNPRLKESKFLRDAVADGILKVCTTPDFSAIERHSDAGEASAIALAIERQCGVLMDDKAGRSAANNAGIPVVGTVGVLLLAKRKGALPLVKPLLEELAASGYFLSDQLLAAALGACGE